MMRRDTPCRVTRTLLVNNDMEDVLRHAASHKPREPVGFSGLEQTWIYSEWLTWSPSKALAMYGRRNITDATSRFKPAMCLAYFFMKPQQRMAKETIRVRTPTRQPAMHMSWLFTSFHSNFLGFLSTSVEAEPSESWDLTLQWSEQACFAITYLIPLGQPLCSPPKSVHLHPQIAPLLDGLEVHEAVKVTALISLLVWTSSHLKSNSGCSRRLGVAVFFRGFSTCSWLRVKKKIVLNKNCHQRTEIPLPWNTQKGAKSPCTNDSCCNLSGLTAPAERSAMKMLNKRSSAIWNWWLSLGCVW